MKQLDKSVPLFEDVLKRQEAKLGRQHPDTQMTVANLGVNYKDSGRLNAAIPLLEEVYRTSGQCPNLRWVRAPLLGAYAKAGRSVEAAKLVSDILADARKTAPKDSPQLAGALAQSGLTLLQARGLSRGRAPSPRMPGDPREDPAGWMEHVQRQIHPWRCPAEPEEVR